MGEIKSALELAMERSKKYAVSDEERQKIKEKELLQKATGLFNRYMESFLPLHEVAREIEKMGDETGQKMKEALLSLCVDGLSLDLDKDPERLFPVIELAKGKDLPDIKTRVHALFTSYRDEIERARQRAILGLTEALREEKIYGDAVLPNVEENDRWKQTLDGLSRSYEGRLEEIKRALKKL